jgi:hypothetical protein
MQPRFSLLAHGGAIRENPRRQRGGNYGSSEDGGILPGAGSSLGIALLALLGWAGGVRAPVRFCGGGARRRGKFLTGSEVTPVRFRGGRLLLAAASGGVVR